MVWKRQQDVDAAAANEHGERPSFYSMTAIPAASWHRILDELRRGEAGMIRAWLYDLDAPELAGGVMTLRARNEAQLRHLDRCRTALARCAQLGLGRLISLDLQLESDPKETDNPAEPCEPLLRPEFTLDQFVVGPENQLAHAAALRFLNQAGAEYNPLFVHGPAGAGKTHLLQAMCVFCNPREVLPPSALRKGGGLYMTAQRFVAEFTESQENFAPDRFREQFAQAELVVLDDIDFFSCKSRSQEELFHVINGLLSAGKRLILAADRPPAAIAGIEIRLTSRFGAGLVIAMDPPTAETRVRIIEQKNRVGAFEFPPEALRQIAERCAPQDLDRVLARLDELAQGNHGPFTMGLVNDVFREPVREAAFA